MTLHAKVFISCGQREDLGEVEVANALAATLAEEGFEPYVAATQQTLRGLKENIFEQLAESEYFIFVDFAREQIVTNGTQTHRGSVFSQQELAIAAYLEIDVIAFQEEGVRPLEGILRFMQANCLPFNDRATLPERVMEVVKERRWSPIWKNALSIDTEVSVHKNVHHFGANVMGDFYHITVRNNHIHKAARNVYGYLDRVVEVETSSPVEYGAAEFKWAGYTLPNAMIPPGGARKLDAFWIPHNNPNSPQFNSFTDSTVFVPHILGPGQWYLEYSVASDTVRGAVRKFLLTLDGSVHGVNLEAV